MSGHREGIGQIMATLDGLPSEALAAVREHLDALISRRAQNGDDPSEAPES